MDDLRFDEIARSLGAVDTRRGAVRLLAIAAGVLVADRSGLDSEAAQAAKKRKRRSLCPAKPFRRCTAPAAETLRAAVENCEPQCAEPNSAACQSCLEPAVDAMVAAVNTCEDEVCRGGLGPDEAAGATGGKRRLRVAAASCDSAALAQCRADANADAKVCYAGAALGCLGGPASCAGGIAICGTQAKLAWERCNRPPNGCGAAGYCIQNTCCPGFRDTVCNGTCCRYDQCERCVGGACVGCKRPAQCGRTPAGNRECQCPSVAFTRCGDTCCDTRAPGCETCEAGSASPSVSPRRFAWGRLSRPASAPTAPTSAARPAAQRDRRAATRPSSAGRRAIRAAAPSGASGARSAAVARARSARATAAAPARRSPTTVPPTSRVVASASAALRSGREKSVAWPALPAPVPPQEPVATAAGPASPVASSVAARAAPPAAATLGAARPATAGEARASPRRRTTSDRAQLGGNFGAVIGSVDRGAEEAVRPGGSGDGGGLSWRTAPAVDAGRSRVSAPYAAPRPRRQR